MKKIIFNSVLVNFIIIITTILSCNSVQNNKKDDIKKSDIEKWRLFGKVKSLKSIGFKLVEKFGEMSKDEPTYSNHIIFNKDGNIIVKEIFNSKGELESKYVYNNEGKILEENWRRWGGLEKLVFTYDTGQLIEKNNYYSDGSLESRVKYKYDYNGQLIEKNTYNSDGGLRRMVKNRYNEMGNMLEMNSFTYNSDGIYVMRNFHKYNDEGNLIESNYYYNDGVNHDKEVFDGNGNVIVEIRNDLNKTLTSKSINYDDFGNKLEEVKFDSDGVLIYKTKIEYNEMGNKLEQINYGSNRSIERKIVFKYDDFGNELERVEFGPEGKVKHKSYKKYSFDKNNNWIKLITYENEIPKNITERTIEYYP